MTSSSGLEQDQFLTILSREEALARFEAALDLEPLGRERVPLGDLVGRVLAKTVEASVDTPPFDRSVVDGFALLASDVVAASDSIPTLLTLNGEYIACGHQPAIRLLPGTATPIATGGPVPRGADAVVMMEHTSLAPEGALLVGRAIGAGQNVAFAGSDIARGEVLLRRGTVLGSREIGMLAAMGLAEVEVFRRPRIAVISTGDELVPPGEALRPATLYDSNGAIIAAALQENGCKPVPYGAIPDNLEKLSAIVQAAHAACDGVILSGGTSKGAGDLTYRIVAALGQPGIVAHGVALKPGKPLCLAVCGGKPVVVLPGFPTSAMFTFHDMIAPVLRKLAGQPERETARLPATLAVRIASEMGRTEFVMVSLSDGPDGPVAYPVAKAPAPSPPFHRRMAL
jgi:putative molybdopterin biosynthesis protein